MLSILGRVYKKMKVWPSNDPRVVHFKTIMRETLSGKRLLNSRPERPVGGAVVRRGRDGGEELAATAAKRLAEAGRQSRQGRSAAL